MPRSHTLKLTAGIALTAAAALVFALLLGPHLSSALAQAGRTPLWMFAAAAGLSLVCLLARTEAWRVCLHAAADAPLCRRSLHTAAAGTYLVNAVNHHLGPLVRVGVLRRMAPAAAPRPMQMLAADAPALLIECATMTALVLLAAAFFGFPLWTAGAAVGLVAAVACALVVVRRRVERPFVHGLRLLDDRRLVGRVAGLFALVAAAQLIRTWLMLSAAGMQPSLGTATLALVAGWAAGVLPVGAAAGPSGTVAAVGSHNAAAAGAAGMTLMAAALIASALYGLVAALVHASRSMFLRMRGPLTA